MGKQVTHLDPFHQIKSSRLRLPPILLHDNSSQLHDLWAYHTMDQATIYVTESTHKPRWMARIIKKQPNPARLSWYRSRHHVICCLSTFECFKVLSHASLIFYARKFENLQINFLIEITRVRQYAHTVCKYAHTLCKSCIQVLEFV